jgi:hypothetical protein
MLFLIKKVGFEICKLSFIFLNKNLQKYVMLTQARVSVSLVNMRPYFELGFDFIFINLFNDFVRV